MYQQILDELFKYDEETVVHLWVEEGTVVSSPSWDDMPAEIQDNGKFAVIDRTDNEDNDAEEVYSQLDYPDVV
jgi:hypothetical protein